jgi:hypothetical protein
MYEPPPPSGGKHRILTGRLGSETGRVQPSGFAFLVKDFCGDRANASAGFMPETFSIASNTSGSYSFISIFLLGTRRVAPAGLQNSEARHLVAAGIGTALRA